MLRQKPIQPFRQKKILLHGTCPFGRVCVCVLGEWINMCDSYFMHDIIIKSANTIGINIEFDKQSDSWNKNDLQYAIKIFIPFILYYYHNTIIVYTTTQFIISIGELAFNFVYLFVLRSAIWHSAMQKQQEDEFFASFQCCVWFVLCS